MNATIRTTDGREFTGELVFDSAKRVDAIESERIKLRYALIHITEAHEKLLAEYGKPFGWGLLEVENAKSVLGVVEGGGQ